MVVDMAWLALFPQTVASPYTIIVHHAFALMGVNMAVIDPELAFWCSIGLTVEFNTVFLLLKRNFPDIPVFAVLFNVSWVAIRNMLYPVSLYVYCFEFWEMSRVKGSWVHAGTGVLATMTLLNALFVKWTFDQVVKSEKKDKGM